MPKGRGRLTAGVGGGEAALALGVASMNSDTNRPPSAAAQRDRVDMVTFLPARVEIAWA